MKNTQQKIFTLIFILLSSVQLGNNVYAAQLEQAFTTAYRYNLGGQLTGVIYPDPDGGGALRLMATRNTYNLSTGLLEVVEKGELKSWLDENISPASWTNFTIFSTQVIGYDSYGRKATVTVKDKLGTPLSLTQTNYDSNSRINCVAVRMNAATFSSPGSLPDACVQGTQGLFGPDRITRYTYNVYDQVTDEIRGEGTPLAQRYVGNTYEGRLLTSQTDAQANKTEFRYDPLYKRLIRIVYPSLTEKLTVNEADYVEFSNFDSNGNAKTARKRNGAIINYTFDSANRVTLKDYADNIKQRDIYYDYDLRGLQTLASFGNTSTSDRTVQQYDGFGNLDTAIIAMSGVTRAVYSKYDLNNNRTRVNYGDGVYFDYGFDNLNRMGVIFEGAGVRTLQIDYNPDGNRKRIYRLSGISSTNYSFSNGVQLDSFTQDFAGTSNDLTNSFQYNPAGQISQLTLGNNLYYYNGNENRVGVYEPDYLNRYSKIAGQPLGYDGNSNLTNDGTLTYQYDDENRLIGTGGAVTSSFVYDPRGRLFESTINGTKTQFLYDGDKLIAEFNGNGVMQRRYVHGDRADEPLLQYNSNAIGASARRYLHADHQGSIIAHSDVNGNVLAKLAYDSFGIPAAGNTDRFGYTGQAWFKELGLFHYKARMYHPKIGRFLQTDPIGYKDDMNLYAYVGNDPINKNDPSGLAQCDKSLQGAKCDQALDDSDKARDNARNVATGLTDIAGRMKNGKITAQDKTDLAAVEKKFGSKFTTEKGLTKLANGLNGAADKIGARGAGATLTAGSATATYPARANSFTQTVILHDRYFKTSDSDTREQYMLHESAHLDWKWGDQYIENGVNPLFNSDRAFNNADTYSCAVYPSVCGF